MTDYDPHDTVKVAADKLVTIEMYQAALKAAGIESKITGPVIDPGLLMAPLNLMELWVHRSDVEKAQAAIDRLESERKHPTHEAPQFPRPESEGHPHKGGHGPHTHHNPDPKP